MANTFISELIILLLFIFTLILCFYDKIELFINNDTRNLLGYLILFSIVGNYNYCFNNNLNRSLNICITNINL